MKQILEFFGSSMVAVLVAGAVVGIFAALPMGLGKVAEASLLLPQTESGANQAFMEYHITTRGDEGE